MVGRLPPPAALFTEECGVRTSRDSRIVGDEKLFVGGAGEWASTFFAAFFAEGTRNYQNGMLPKGCTHPVPWSRLDSGRGASLHRAAQKVIISVMPLPVGQPAKNLEYWFSTVEGRQYGRLPARTGNDCSTPANPIPRFPFTEPRGPFVASRTATDRSISNVVSIYLSNVSRGVEASINDYSATDFPSQVHTCSNKVAIYLWKI